MSAASEGSASPAAAAAPSASASPEASAQAPAPAVQVDAPPKPSGMCLPCFQAWPGHPGSPMPEDAKQLCGLCLGIMTHAQGIADAVVARLRQSGYEHESVCLRLNLPVDLSIRHSALALEAENGRPPRFAGLTVKHRLRRLLGQVLQEQLGMALDDKSPLALFLTLKHRRSSDETHRLQRLFFAAKVGYQPPRKANWYNRKKSRSPEVATIRQVDADGFTANLVNRAIANLSLEDYHKEILPLQPMEILPPRAQPKGRQKQQAPHAKEETQSRKMEDDVAEAEAAPEAVSSAASASGSNPVSQAPKDDHRRNQRGGKDPEAAEGDAETKNGEAGPASSSASSWEELQPRAFRWVPPVTMEETETELVPDNLWVVAGAEMEAVVLLGNYCKYSRELTQSRWFHRGARVGSGSVEEFMGPPGMQLFRARDFLFQASGREDKDVRMLGSGRPFSLELKDPRTHRIPVEKVVELEHQINASANSLIRITGLRIGTKAELQALKDGIAEKRKVYRCVVFADRQLSQADLDRLAEVGELKVKQQTPLRVLHRRSAMTRDKTIFSMQARSATPTSFVLTLCASAGTYIKEFVHGDRGRTLPNVGEILGCRVDILQLDVLGMDA